MGYVRGAMSERDREMLDRFDGGDTITVLAAEYGLSEKTVIKILYSNGRRLVGQMPGKADRIVPGGYYAVVSAPCGRFNPLRVYTAVEIQKLIAADRLPDGARLEDHRGRVLEYHVQGKRDWTLTPAGQPRQLGMGL
jgi:hypothetical protein